ncbi:TetR/AcrR family transcriptional regulator [Bacillus sp. T33-2]|uniref:TetR/AcrR family transcriptional regulator n=1 Tax=Bacillus sp. T33-2 TaxID=2054168 RepID=UPI000C75DB66|nr:TetR/AcrR family transcriptional regulator [Bacillus sp. T33-2]PLR96757.1 TetR/AcrR family transcriptional regulator [Bacillus sp. T33-2]
MSPIVSDAYKERKKREILDSALACFAKKGYEAATIDDIVARSGISKGAIYNYFKSKDEIYLELMTQDTRDKNIQIIRQISEYKTALEKVHYLFDMYLSLDPFDDGNKASILVHYEFKLHSSRNQELIRVFKERRDELFITLLKSVIKDGQNAGEFNKAIDPVLYADLFWTMIDGVTLQTVYENYPYHEVLKELKNIYIEKLMNE